MAIAFKKPFTQATQELRNSVDLEQSFTDDVKCHTCGVLYLVAYPRSSNQVDISRYKQAVDRGMGNCTDHPPFIRIDS